MIFKTGKCLILYKTPPKRTNFYQLSPTGYFKIVKTLMETYINFHSEIHPVRSRTPQKKTNSLNTMTILTNYFSLFQTVATNTKSHFTELKLDLTQPLDQSWNDVERDLEKHCERFWEKVPLDGPARKKWRELRRCSKGVKERVEGFAGGIVSCCVGFCICFGGNGRHSIFFWFCCRLQWRGGCVSMIGWINRINRPELWFGTESMWDLYQWYMHIIAEEKKDNKRKLTVCIHFTWLHWTPFPGRTFPWGS